MTAEKRVRVNQQIRVDEVRLIDIDGNQLGVVSRDDALDRAGAVGADLVEISPNADPPVCRIMDYGKYRFEQSKKAAVAKKKQKVFQLKEMKFRPTTDEGDYQVKLRKLLGFLNDGNKAKVTIRFRGREMAHQDLGVALANRIRTDLEEYSIVEQEPKLEGRQIVMVLGPRRA